MMGGHEQQRHSPETRQHPQLISAPIAKAEGLPDWGHNRRKSLQHRGEGESSLRCRAGSVG